jgi:nicotinate-nucleotide adenylyltransferase
MRVGLLGGSFNPAHQGHRHISTEAIKRLGLNQVWWLVSPQNPLKQPYKKSLKQRVQLAEKVARHPRIKILDIEKQQSNNYSFNTIKKLQQRHPNYKFVWLMGADNLGSFHKWYRWHDILRKIVIVIFDRGDYFHHVLRGKFASRYRRFRSIPTLLNYRLPNWSFIKMRKHNISSSLIRKKYDK